MTSFRLWLVGVGIVALVALLALANGAKAGEYGCSACQGDSGWSGERNLEEMGNPASGTTSEILPGLSTVQKSRVGKWNQPLHGFANESNATDESSAAKSDSSEKPVQSESKPTEEVLGVRSDDAKSMLVPIDEVPSDCILLDVSDNATEHIQGSIAIPYTNFLHEGNLRSVEEISQILGDAGISNEDCLIVYGECMPCGRVPAPATLVYWMMRTLGHENIRVLDGDVHDWKAAGKPTSTETVIKPPKTYTPRPTEDFIATYDYVKSGTPQIVDAQSMQDFGLGSILDAINRPYESMVSDGRIKDEARLERIFASLDRNRPVVVYTGQPTFGSVAWFAAKLMGYDAKLYSYENWQYNQRNLGSSTT